MANTIKLKRASGSNPSASDLAAGELAIRTSNCALFSKNDSGSVVQINDLINDTSPQLGGNLDVQSSKITTATSNGNVQVEPNGTGVFEVRGAGGNDGTLQLNCSAQSHGIKLKSPAHSAGASYTLTFPDDVQNGKFLQTDTNGNLSWQSATNISNNNQLTNGAGYITATLTNEQVQDIVGAMVTGNTETGITVTYQDSDGTIDFVVGTLNQNTTGSAATLTTARNIAGVAFDGSANISLDNNNITNGAGYITGFTGVAGGGTFSGDVSFNGGTNAVLLKAHSDIRFEDGNWTGNSTSPKIQAHGNYLYILGGTSGIVFRENDTDRFLVNGDGHFQPGTDSTYDIGLNGTRVRNVYADTLYGDGSNIGSVNAATLDSIDSSSFLRSDAADTASELITLSGGLAFTAAAKCSAALASLTDGSTITVNFTDGIHHSVTLGGNRTFGNPSNDNNAVGQSGSIFITQDGTGGREASFHSDYKFAGGTAPTLSTAANAVDRLDYVIKASGEIHCVVSLDVK